MFYKILTNDFRSPIQGGDAIFDGACPFVTPSVEHGWHFCRWLGDAFNIAGIWPNGRPASVFIVEPVGRWIEHDDGLRAEALRFVRPATGMEIEDGIRDLSQSLEPFVDEMVIEQMEWRKALSRPTMDEIMIKKSLSLALKIRGLDWPLQKYDNARDAWDAWTGAIWGGEAAMDARDAWAAWDAKTVWRAWDGMDARDARDALILFFAAKKGWINYDPGFLTTGLRDAYKSGLLVAIPVRQNRLGWVC